MLFGKSLGGTFALFTERDFSDYISKVSICNPAAGFFCFFSKNEKINIYINCQDPVYYLGRYHPSWNVYASQPQRKLNPFIAHVIAYPCVENSSLVKVHPQSNILRRFLITLCHQVIALLIFPCLLVSLCVKELYIYFKRLIKKLF